jgi:putative tricarboxylic transport membrane protein
MILSDRVSGAILAALGVAAAWSGSRLPPVPGQDVGPNVFPMVIGAGLVVCGALVAFGVGRSFEAPPDEEAEAEPPLLSAATLLRGLRVLLPPALLLFYVLAVERLGFLPTAALIVLAVSLALGGGLRIALPMAVVAPLAVHAVFAKLLRVPLPGGLLPAPW